MNDQKIIDISRKISSNSTVYPGDGPLRLRSLCSIGPGCPCNITELGWTTHFLTHVDPPLHFIDGGSSLDEIPLDRFTGEAIVVEVKGDSVEPEHFGSPLISSGSTVFFKTRNSIQWNGIEKFDENHVYISEAAAKEAVALGINMVGIDYISVDRFGDENYPCHRTLLSNNIIILEGIDLSQVSAGKYHFFAFPLRIEKGDGSPVRALLRAGND